MAAHREERAQPTACQWDVTWQREVEYYHHCAGVGGATDHDEAGSGQLGRLSFDGHQERRLCVRRRQRLAPTTSDGDSQHEQEPVR